MLKRNIYAIECKAPLCNAKLHITIAIGVFSEHDRVFCCLCTWFNEWPLNASLRNTFTLHVFIQNNLPSAIRAKVFLLMFIILKLFSFCISFRFKQEISSNNWSRKKTCNFSVSYSKRQHHPTIARCAAGIGKSNYLRLNLLREGRISFVFIQIDRFLSLTYIFLAKKFTERKYGIVFRNSTFLSRYLVYLQVPVVANKSLSQGSGI